MPNSTTTTPETRAQIAYTAYGKAVGFKAHDGNDMPMFASLPPKRQAAWAAAADVIWSLATTGRATL
jgi:hypothetical protein